MSNKYRPRYDDEFDSYVAAHPLHQAEMARTRRVRQTIKAMLEWGEPYTAYLRYLNFERTYHICKVREIQAMLYYETTGRRAEDIDRAQQALFTMVARCPQPPTKRERQKHRDQWGQYWEVPGPCARNI